MPGSSLFILQDQMRTERNLSISLRSVAGATFLALLASCAAPRAGVQPAALAAARSLHEARSLHFSAEARAAHYLDAAALTAPRLGSGKENTPARETYNAASGELTTLLRSHGELWNRPLTITSEKTTYHLQL